MKLTQNSTLIFLGDSVTDCGRSPDGEWLLGSGYPSLISTMFRLRYPQAAVRFLNKGTSGDQTRHILARLQQDVLDCHPDYVTLLIGINDVWRFFDRPHSNTMSGVSLTVLIPTPVYPTKNTGEIFKKSSNHFLQAE